MILETIYSLILEVERKEHINKIKDDFLKGAFKKYLTRELSLEVNKEDQWSKEISNLLKQIDKNVPKNFNKDKLFNQVMIDIYPDLKSVFSDSKTKTIKYHKTEQTKRSKLNIYDSFEKMLSEFKPDLIGYWKNAREYYSEN
jgi:hypothetical protein